jgi:hypothetical protein
MNEVHKTYRFSGKIGDKSDKNHLRRLLKVTYFFPNTPHLRAKIT